MIVFGQGSEWFWSMLQFVVVAITLLAIYRQVRLQASASALEQMNAIVQEWRSESLVRHTLTLREAIRDGVPWADLPYGAASTVGDFWEGIGYLVGRGHIDRNLLHQGVGGAPQWWWAALSEWAAKVRADTEDPQALEYFEWLAGEMAAIDRRGGR